ncbi:MAG: hypothetical protein HRU19_10635 [Pseudobacteriovorax sp.]|nr:hypothetical protein [Pseudobacteriovorax sp.]
MRRTSIFPLALLLFAMLSTACVDNPLEKLQKDLSIYDEYSITLQDMRQSSGFPEFEHQYDIITVSKPAKVSETIAAEMGEQTKPQIERYKTEWLPVPESVYEQYQNNLGMTILSKLDNGELQDSSGPPGYNYVGNPQYGRWVQRDGLSFWEFYGAYRLFGDLIGGFGRPIYRDDYDRYRDYRRQRRPYYGRDNRWGTNGSYTKKSNPTFYQRRKALEAKRKANFSSRFNKRVNRSKSSSYRSRSRGFGK